MPTKRNRSWFSKKSSENKNLVSSSGDLEFLNESIESGKYDSSGSDSSGSDSSGSDSSNNSCSVFSLNSGSCTSDGCEINGEVFTVGDSVGSPIVSSENSDGDNSVDCCNRDFTEEVELLAVEFLNSKCPRPFISYDGTQLDGVAWQLRFDMNSRTSFSSLKDFPNDKN